MQWRSFVRERLPAAAVGPSERLDHALRGWLYQRNLTRLAMVFGTDKWGAHWYTQHYQRALAGRRREPVKVLEIGVGGYAHTRQGGASLRMWKAFFRRGQIVGIDLYDKSALRERRIDIWQCDQTDAAALKRLSDQYGGFDVIIDDGSHLNEHVVKTFEILFPLLRDGGLYAIEDIQTSYWPSWGGGRDNPNASMPYFQRLTDGLNHVEYPLRNYVPSYFDRHITSIAFFHNLVLITKGDNNEEPNTPGMIAKELEAAES